MEVLISFPDILLIFLFFQHFIGLQEHTLHDSFSETDIKVGFDDFFEIWLNEINKILRSLFVRLFHKFRS
jgi:hypothetical protein